jgi:hypothetical protein
MGSAAKSGESSSVGERRRALSRSRTLMGLFAVDAGSRRRIDASELWKSEASQLHDPTRACHARFPLFATTILACELVENGWTVIKSSRPVVAIAASRIRALAALFSVFIHGANSMRTPTNRGASIAVSSPFDARLRVKLRVPRDNDSRQRHRLNSSRLEPVLPG